MEDYGPFPNFSYSLNYHFKFQIYQKDDGILNGRIKSLLARGSRFILAAEKNRIQISKRREVCQVFKWVFNGGLA